MKLVVVNNKNIYFSWIDLFSPSQRIGYFRYQVKFNKPTTIPLTMIIISEWPSVGSLVTSNHPSAGFLMYLPFTFRCWQFTKTDELLKVTPYNNIQQ